MVSGEREYAAEPAHAAATLVVRSTERTDQPVRRKSSATPGREPLGAPSVPVSYTHLDVYKRQLGEDGDSEFGDLIEDSEAVVPADAVNFTLLQEQLHDVLDTLSEREAGVVSMRFGLTLSLIHI